MREENQTIIKALNMFGKVPETWELLNEIERLNNIIKEQSLLLIEFQDMEQKLNETFFELEDLQKENERLRTVLNGSEEKRKKAIEYITNNKLYTFKYDDEELFEITTDKKAKDDLLKILGGDKNDNQTNN